MHSSASLYKHVYNFSLRKPSEQDLNKKRALELSAKQRCAESDLFGFLMVVVF